MRGEGRAQLALEGLCWGYASTLSLGPLSLELGPGDHLAVIGPNGAGKSTLLRTLAGELAPLGGAISFGGADPSTLDVAQRARYVALLRQSPSLDLELRVRDLVELGRTPHLGLWGRMTPRDESTVDEALVRCDLTQLAGRALGEISGGERQRARLAMVMAQKAPLVLLDEPTTHLDLRRRYELFSLVSELRRDDVVVVSVLHEPAEALREATRVLLMGADGVVELPEGEATRREMLASAFDVPAERIVL